MACLTKLSKNNRYINRPSIASMFVQVNKHCTSGFYGHWFHAIFETTRQLLMIFLLNDIGHPIQTEIALRVTAFQRSFVDLQYQGAKGQKE